MKIMIEIVILINTIILIFLVLRIVTIVFKKEQTRITIMFKMKAVFMTVKVSWMKVVIKKYFEDLI